MVLIQGGFIGPADAAGTIAYLNRLDTRRVETLVAFDGRPGVWEGFAYSGVAGQMQLSFTPGIGLAAERDGSNNEMRRGYIVWSDTTSVVQFGAASAAARNDAVVLAAVDVEDAGFGTGVSVAGGYLIAVPGVSGTSAVRTDAQIAAYLGRGGWVRLLDVPIASTDTQINMSNIVPTPAVVAWADSGAVSNAFTASAGWSLVGQSLRRVRGITFFEITFSRTGANIVTGASGNITNSPVATWDTAKYPILVNVSCNSTGTGQIAAGFASAGTVSLCSVGYNGNVDITAGNQFSLAGCWP